MKNWHIRIFLLSGQSLQLTIHGKQMNDVLKKLEQAFDKGEDLDIRNKDGYCLIKVHGKNIGSWISSEAPTEQNIMTVLK